MVEDYDSVRLLKGFIEMMEDQNKKYDPEGKFGGEYDADLATLISRAIDNKKLKVEPPVKDK